MIIRRRTKGLLITILSVLFVAVLVMMAEVLSNSFHGLRGVQLNWPGRTFAETQTTNQTSTSLKRSYQLSNTETFSLSVPLGKVSVVQGNGQKVHLVANLTYGSWFGATSSRSKSPVHLVSTRNASGVQVTLQGLEGNVQAKQAYFTLTVPKDMRLEVHNDLGIIQVNGGTYTTLTLHDNMGAMEVSADVAKSLDLEGNMGAITYTGKLAQVNKLVNNMGAISITDTAKQSIRYHLTTNLGEASAVIPSSNISDKGTDISGTSSGTGPAVTLTSTNNLGAIHLQGE